MAERRSGAGHAAAYRRVGAFAVLLLVLSGLSFVFGILPLDDLPRPFTIPWPLMTAMFYLAEIKVIHIHFRRETQTFSLNEIPLVLGLYFSPPIELVVAATIGGVAALVVSRRQRGVKLGVNTGHLLAATVLAVWFFHNLAPAGGPPGPASWLVAGLAAIAAAFVNVLAIYVAIALSEGRAESANLPQIFTAATVAAVTASALALIGVMLMWVAPAAAVLLAIPATSLYLAFRAYASEKQKHQSLEFLYESSRILQEAPEVSGAVAGLLTEARRTFRSDVAEVTLFPADEHEPLLRTSVGPGDHHAEMVPVPLTPEELAFVDAIHHGRSHVVTPGTAQGPELHPYLTHRGFRDAMIVPLRGETRIIGAMVLADRLGQVTPFRDDELRLFETLANNASVSLENTRLERTLTELSTLKDELRHRAYHDSLTGLANRALFSQRVDEGVSAATRPGQLAILYLDLDDFKTVNDTLGHDAGDELLVEVAERLRACLRPGDLAARLGGDEFAVLVEHPATPDLPEQLAERIIASLRYPIRVQDKDLAVRSSIGIAVHDHESSGELIRNADIAMYRAKHTTKGRYAIYEPGMHDALSDRLELRTELLLGVESEQFVVHYQPFYDLRTEAIVGFEALVRWEHPVRGLVPPDDFIALAEDTGLVLPIGDLVVRTACRQLAEWQARFSPGLVMSVNISARQLKHETLLRTIQHAIDDTGIRPESLILEITERDVMDDSESNLDKLAALKAVGVQLAIDDFGTGYSSLAYLRRFPMDIVKIAKPFVDGITQVGDGGVLARAIIELSRALSMDTIAEGIETPDQLARLTEWNCPVGQGWLFAKAVQADDAERLLVEARRAQSRPAPPHLTAVPRAPAETA